MARRVITAREQHAMLSPWLRVSYTDAMGEQNWNEIYPDLPDTIHRGIGITLPDDLHKMAHDPSIPIDQRAQALLRHIGTPEARTSPWGHDSREGLGTSWSGDEGVAEDFGRSMANQHTDHNQKHAGENDDHTWGTDEDGDPVGKPGTAVMLHAELPDIDSIDDNPNGDGSGQRYTYHGHGEQEVPVHGGHALHIKGISWRPILPTFHPDYLTDPEEYTRHEFGENNYHTAALPDIQQIIDSYRQNPRAKCRSTPEGASGWCEDAMEDFINYAHDNGVHDISRREFNYPLRSSYPEPHKSLMWSPRSGEEEESTMWDGFHYAPVVNIKGVPHVVDWTARQLNHEADFPHVEPLDSYGANFGYHVDYEPPHPYGTTNALDARRAHTAALSEDEGRKMREVYAPHDPTNPPEHLRPHLMLPIGSAHHYREYDRPYDDVLGQVIADQGIRQPLRISTDGTHATMHEGNHRLEVAKRLGLTHVPVQVTLEKPGEVINNGGRPPAPLEGHLGEWVDQNRHRLKSFWS